MPKNYCNRTSIVKVIVENVVTCSLGGHSVVRICCALLASIHTCMCQQRRSLKTGLAGRGLAGWTEAWQFCYGYWLFGAILLLKV